MKDHKQVLEQFFVLGTVTFGCFFLEGVLDELQTEWLIVVVQFKIVLDHRVPSPVLDLVLLVLVP